MLILIRKEHFFSLFFYRFFLVLLAPEKESDLSQVSNLVVAPRSADFISLLPLPLFPSLKAIFSVRPISNGWRPLDVGGIAVLVLVRAPPAPCANKTFATRPLHEKLEELRDADRVGLTLAWIGRSLEDRLIVPSYILQLNTYHT